VDFQNSIFFLNLKKEKNTKTETRGPDNPFHILFIFRWWCIYDI